MSHAENQIRLELDSMLSREPQMVAFFAVDVSFINGASEPTITLHVAPVGKRLSHEQSDEWHAKLREMGAFLRRAYDAGEFTPRA